MEDWIPFFFFVIVIGVLLWFYNYAEANLTPFYNSSITEGFTDTDQVPGATEESKGVIQWFDNTTLYDSFYAKVYDQLTQGSVRTQAEVGLLATEWTKRGEDLKSFDVLAAVS